MASLGKRLKNDLIYALVLSVVRFIRRLPRSAALNLGARLGWLAYHVIPRERKLAEHHLQFGLCVGPRRAARLAREVFGNLGRNAVDAVRMGRLLENGSLESVLDVRGREHLDRALARGKGVMCITGHIGNWELLAAWLAKCVCPLWAVGAQIYDPRLNELVVQTRRTAGVKAIARGRNTRDILRALRSGEMVGMLVDQDTRVEGVFVDFMGTPAHTAVGPAALARKTGASMVPLAIHMNPDGTHTIEIGEEIRYRDTGDLQRDLLETVRRYSKAVEGYIRAHPTQWVWMHRRWKTRPEHSVSN